MLKLEPVFTKVNNTIKTPEQYVKYIQSYQEILKKERQMRRKYTIRKIHKWIRKGKLSNFYKNIILKLKISCHILEKFL